MGTVQTPPLRPPPHKYSVFYAAPVHEIPTSFNDADIQDWVAAMKVVA